MQTSAMKACFQKEESTPYDGVDSLKQILILSTFQFTRFQPTELNSLLVSTSLSVSLHRSDFKRGLSPALSLTNGKCIKNLMSHQIFNKKSDGFLLYFTSQRLHSLLLPASIPCNYSASLLKTLNRKALKYEIGFDSQ